MAFLVLLQLRLALPGVLPGIRCVWVDLRSLGFFVRLRLLCEILCCIAVLAFALIVLLFLLGFVLLCCAFALLCFALP